jgi:hypothetical protein
MCAGQKQEHLMNWNNRFEMLLLLFFLTSSGKVLSLLYKGCRSACVKMAPNGGVQIFSS